MDAAEHDDVGLGLLRLEAQPQRIADIIGDVLDLRDLVIVRQDDGVALAFEAQDFLRQIGARAMPRRGRFKHGYHAEI